MDGYRFCIVNSDSFIETVENHPDGKVYFIRRYMKLLL